MALSTEIVPRKRAPTVAAVCERIPGIRFLGEQNVELPPDATMDQPFLTIHGCRSLAMSFDDGIWLIRSSIGGRTHADLEMMKRLADVLVELTDGERDEIG